MKNAIFQYATSHEVIVNTDLITIEEAKSLFYKNKQDFIDRLEKGETPEMCIWVNCKTRNDYSETALHWFYGDFKVIDGELYKIV